MPVRTLLVFLPCLALLASIPGALTAQSGASTTPLGYASFTAEAKAEQAFLAIPDPHRAGEDLRILTAEPHMAATPGDRRTADYVAQKFRAAGLDTQIVSYRVLLDWPKLVRVEAWDAAGHRLLEGPTPEHVQGDRYQNNPHAVIPFNASSASGDVTGEVVYANYGRLEDFNALVAHHIDLHGKIVLCRYGANFRGVKVYLAEQRGAIGVLLYSDPEDDGANKGDPWPEGPWRPDTGIQYGSVQYLFKYPGDPETPGFASTPDLPASSRIPAAQTGNQPHIVSIPISAHDAEPILRRLTGSIAPAEWQGGLPIRYHFGPGGVTVHLVSQQNYQLRTIWDVIGTVRGARLPNSWVMAGNHRDAWIYGAVDPSSGTAAMLEAVRGIGVLLHRGWRPRRTLIFCSWDAEEEGLIGSTEWVEQHIASLNHAVAYFNMDTGVSGSSFGAASTPSLQRFLREVTRSVSSPLGGTVYDQWMLASTSAEANNAAYTPFSAAVRIGNLGSGSDFTPFFQHAGVPSTEISSDGPYGAYHSVFDNYDWYVHNADPDFVYLQEMARVFGIEVLRMAGADVLPFDYVSYAQAISIYLQTAQRKADDAGLKRVSFASAQAALARFTAAAQLVARLQAAPSGDCSRLNQALRQTERALLSPAGLPSRPWYRHTIFAPGEFTGYAVQVLPGVNEAIDAHDAAGAARQLTVLAQALDRAAQTLHAAR